MKKVFIFIVLFLFAFNLSAQFLKPREKEIFKYRIIPNKGDSFTSLSSYSAFQDDSGEILYRYVVDSPKDNWDVVAHGDGTPKSVLYKDDNGELNISFAGSGRMRVQGEWKGKVLDVEDSFSSQITLENTLYLRTMDLYPGCRKTFEILHISKLPRFKTFTVAFEVIGKETVEVPAGVFKCWKVLFSLDGAGSNLFKSYYYVTRDDSKKIVLMDKLPMVGRIELESIQ